uniref:Protein kinase domain-containing protein n=1 Tax=Chromera velia CCMP2878 TaxID=1169474 RepID=A0A0G4FXZ0_9ALVE|eukprot:Cvel_3902.t1-p1 / transcript=Cvel_3902.t1 / gene=Cvel_3902 / organism=Chromera_velia_CCMP2878 / gene_product=Shaggy-related protein kinase epsilon, putative / transcript_product=Shaggy-related protein kinase epsilon, putative / location=Cvel_scaffold165:57598-61046(-) / protein_length=380 / sequence_SO=supercontig / SO=protein_coding / is_pseudo=false
MEATAEEKTAQDKGDTKSGSTSGGARARSKYTYDAGKGKILGNGSFGVVTEARCLETGEVVAIKQVLQDPRYKNRELDVMKVLAHPNIVELKDYYYTDAGGRDGGNPGEKFLNVVMEFIPDTVYRVIKTFVRNSQYMPMILVKLYSYQMCRALGYLHTLGICHRDIKPQNLLVDTRLHVLKLCDFGSAKTLVPGEPSVAYICSRYYRAPELMLGATEYTTAIDIWSIGCVLGEMILGRPLFAGNTSVDQLVKIIQTMGTPTREQMSAMNHNYTDFRFPDVRPKAWSRIFHSHTPPEALDLISQLLRYEPQLRLKPLDALAHPFFDELRQRETRLPTGGTLPPLFNFTEAELRAVSSDAREKLIPEWYGEGQTAQAPAKAQ